MFLYGLFLICLFFNIQASEVVPFSYTSSEATTPLNDSTEVVPFTYVSSDSEQASDVNDSNIFERPLSAGSRASTRTWSSQEELRPLQPTSPLQPAPPLQPTRPLQPTPPLQPKGSQRPQLTPNTQPASPNIVQSPTYSQASPVEPKTIPTTPVVAQPTSGMKIFNPEGAKESEKLRAAIQSEQDEIFFTEKAKRIKKLLKSDLLEEQKKRAIERNQTNQSAHASSYIMDNVFVNLLSDKKPVSSLDKNIDISPGRANDPKREVLEDQLRQIQSQIDDLKSIPSDSNIKNRIRILLEELKSIHSKLAQHHDMLATETLLNIADSQRKLNLSKDTSIRNMIKHDLRKANIALEYHQAQQRMHKNIIHDIYEDLKHL